MGEVLKFVTPDGGLRKKAQKILKFFAQITQFWNFSRLNFGLKDLFWAAQNMDKISIKNKKKWRAQAKLLDVLSNDIMRKAMKRS